MALTWQSTIAFDSAFTSDIIAIAASSDTVFVLTADNMVTPVTFMGVKGTPFTPAKRSSSDIWKGMDTTEAGKLVIAFNTRAALAGWRVYELDGTYVSEVYPLTVFGGAQREPFRGFCRALSVRGRYIVNESGSFYRIRVYSERGASVSAPSIKSSTSVVKGLASSPTEFWRLHTDNTIQNYDVNIAYVDLEALPTGVTQVDGIAYDGTHVWLADSDALYYTGELATPEPPISSRQLYLHDNSKLIANLDVTTGLDNSVKHLNIPAVVNASIDISRLTITGFRSINFAVLSNIAEITPINVLGNIEILDKVFFHSGDADTAPTEAPDVYWEVKGLLNTGNKKQQTLICESNKIVI